MPTPPPTHGPPLPPPPQTPADIPNAPAQPTQPLDSLLADLNRVPLFMTSLDETDGAGGTNAALDGLRALAYEGPPSEVAANFKSQGNERVAERRWGDAREFYSRALEVLAGKDGRGGGVEGEVDWLGGSEGRVVDLEEEERAARGLEEVCAVNRARCHLELKNYRQAGQDCAHALRLNSRNVKAYYRLAYALLSVQRTGPALKSINIALTYTPQDKAVIDLRNKILDAQKRLQQAEKERVERDNRRRDETLALREGLKKRGIIVKMTGGAPKELQGDDEAKVRLENPVDPASQLRLPVLLLYPTTSQSELIKSVGEAETLGQHLEYILPIPWDEGDEFGTGDGGKVECFVETKDGGLRKVGKKVAFGKVLGGGAVEVKDGLVCVFVVPKAKMESWIGEFKRRKGK